MSVKPVASHSQVVVPAPARAYHPTALKVALVAGAALVGTAVVGVLGLASVASLGLIPLSALITMVVIGGIGSMLCFLKAYWAARVKEDLTFAEYVVKKCPGYTLAQANALAECGKEIVQDPEMPSKEMWQKLLPALPEHLKKEAEKLLSEKSTDENALKRILLIPVSWFFMQTAFNTGQGYEKGLIKFEDEENRIVNFFKPAMYARKSSHFGKIRLNSLGYDCPKGLPYIFKHVHMGALPNDFSFIKLEQFGCTTHNPLEFLCHAIDWVRSELVAKPMGERDGPNHRKEKDIPQSIKKAFSEHCKGVKIPKTVAEMVAFIKTLAPEKKKALMEIINGHFPRGNHENRSGNETLLMADDLQIFLDLI